MKIITPGHVYELDHFGPNQPPEILHLCETLRFRNTEAIPNVAGTSTQEVLRALIDRTQHCDRCLRWRGNDDIIHHLRMALVLHEARALERKTEKGQFYPEKTQIDPRDGHFRYPPANSGAV